MLNDYIFILNDRFSFIKKKAATLSFRMDLLTLGWGKMVSHTYSSACWLI